MSTYRRYVNRSGSPARDWCSTHYRTAPLDDAMASALRTSTAQEHALLAATAGPGSGDIGAGADAGRALEERARVRARIAA